MNLFNLTLRLKGFPIAKAKLDYTSIKNINEQGYRTYIDIKKQEIVSYHLKNNVFYKEFAKGANSLNWDSIPVITKADLQIPLKERLSFGFTEKNTHLHKTSGSSGTPLIFAKDKYCHALTWANFMDRYDWYNIDLETSKQARFYGIPLNKLYYNKERLKDFLGNRFRFSVFDLSDQQFEKNLNKFKHSKFEYINGYTSAIVQFAKFLKTKNIVLKTVCPTLKVCITTAEMLFENDKTLLQQQLGIPIINEYGSAELGLIAFNNTTNQWQVNTEDLHIEILDDDNNSLPLGDEGRIVITSLYNLANPFIRYDIGDIGSLDKKSTIKTPILKSLRGRTSDVISLPSGKKAAGLTFYYVTKTVIEDNNNVKEFVIEQLSIDTFKIIYVSSKLLSKEKTNAINDAIATYLEPDLKIIFERKDALKRSKSGKLKQFTSFVK